MKSKAVIIILAVVCVGLGVALLAGKKQANDQHTTDAKSIVDFSNQVVSASKHLDELGQVNLTLSNDLASSQQQLTSSADQMTQLSNTLAAADTTLAATKASLAGTQQQVTSLNNRISDLEAQNQALDQQASSLSNALTQLTAQIETTKNQLAITRTNSAFLQDELQKQLAQRAELEHKFNDLAELRFQIKKIKDEMFVARRLQLAKSDNGSKKGAELLISRQKLSAGVPPHPQPGSNYDLNVEIGSDGSVKVIPPMGGTNNAAH